MDLRQLINLLPFAPARGPLLGLLTRIEGLQATVADLDRRLRDIEQRRLSGPAITEAPRDENRR